MLVGPLIAISSIPSPPCTTIARRVPSALSAFAIGRTKFSSATPNRWKRGRAGLPSDPIRLKMVRIRSSRLQRRNLLERGMIRLREDVAASRGVEASLQPVGIAIDLHAHRFEHVCRAYRAADRAIAVLGDRHARRRRDQRGAGRNVEGAGAVAAGAAGIEHVAIAKIQRTRACEHRAHRACKLVGLGALDFQRDEERADDGVEQLTPLRGTAARIAENMTASLTTIPTATSQRVIPVKAIEENRRVLNERRAMNGEGKISYTHLTAGPSSARSTKCPP